MLLIYGAPAPDEFTPETAAAWERLNETIVEQEAWDSADPLRPAAEATTVRVRDGELVLTDGPFAETHEELAGYYIVDCETVERAIEIARMVPSVGRGSVEVRPIMEIG
jgi:hypothetical protein